MRKREEIKHTNNKDTVTVSYGASVHQGAARIVFGRNTYCPIWNLIESNWPCMD